MRHLDIGIACMGWISMYSKVVIAEAANIIGLPPETP